MRGTRRLPTRVRPSGGLRKPSCLPNFGGAVLRLARCALAQVTTRGRGRSDGKQQVRNFACAPRLCSRPIAGESGTKFTRYLGG
jgi:hypothetical protein